MESLRLDAREHAMLRTYALMKGRLLSSTLEASARVIVVNVAYMGGGDA